MKNSKLGELSAHNALRSLFVFLNGKYGVIKSLERVLEYADDPKFFSFTSVLAPCSKNPNEDELSNTANGFSYFSEEEALVKCLGESLERDASRRFSPQEFEIGTPKEMRDLAIDLSKFITYSKEQRKGKNFSHVDWSSTTNFSWTKAMDLISGEKTYIPAQLVYLAYKPVKNEKYIYLPTSSGLAGGGTFESAVARGVFELIERDAFLIYYLNKLSGKKIDLGNIHSGRLRKLRNYIESYDLEIHCIYLETDIQVPTVLTIIVNRTGIGPAISVGAKTDIDLVDAILGSIQESIHSRGWIRSIVENSPNKLNEEKKEIVTLEDRALLWYGKEKIELLNFFLDQEPVKFEYKQKITDFKDKMELLKKYLKKAKMDLYVVDITPTYLKGFRFKVARTIVPQLQPFYLLEEFPCFGGNRLYNLPNKLGYGARRTFNSLNDYPHPFL